MAYIKLDKNNQICAITHKKGESETPEEYKNTLNMFRGQTRSSIPACFKYLNLSVEAQKGDKEAQKELDNIHRMWNPMVQENNYLVYED